MTYLSKKYGSLANATKVINFLERPTRTKLKKLRARAAAASAALEMERSFNEKLKRAKEANNVDIMAAVAESWNKREKPTSILDTGYSGKNIITSTDARRANLPPLGPSRVQILDANGGVSQAS